MAFSTTPTNGADRLRATADNQTINALGGNDWLFSAFNASTLYGGNGHDLITLELGVPVPRGDDNSRSAALYGGNGNDTLITRFTVPSDRDDLFETSSVQSGGAGSDRILISANSNEWSRVSFDFDVYGGAGADDIRIEVAGGDGASLNFVDAGSGDDVVQIDTGVGLEIGYTVTEVMAGDGDDEVTVSADGGWLADEISEVSLSGGEGNDRLEATMQATGAILALDGGNGDDLLIATSSVGSEFGAGTRTNATGGAGNDTILLTSFATWATVTSIEHTANGGSGDDIITSATDNRTDEFESGYPASANTTLYGGSGNDTLTATTRYDPDLDMTAIAGLHGGTGNDTLRVYGGIENTLDGGSGRDTLIGGSAADRLIGGGGADRLTGNGGDDVFVFASVSGASARTRDAILDFGDGADVIDVSAIDADPEAAGNQAFVFGAGAGAGALWVEAGGGSTSLVKADAGGPELLVIAVRDAADRDWSAADFLL